MSATQFFQAAGQSAASRGLPLRAASRANLPAWAQAAYVRGWMTQRAPTGDSSHG